MNLVGYLRWKVSGCKSLKKCCSYKMALFLYFMFYKLGPVSIYLLNIYPMETKSTPVDFYQRNLCAITILIFITYILMKCVEIIMINNEHY